MLEASRAHEQSKFDQRSGSEGASREPTLAKVRNVSGFVLNQFDVVELTVPLIGPANNYAEFQRNPMFDISLPSGGGRIGVLTEPLDVDKIGTAVIAGVCAVRIAVVGTEYEWAEPISGTAGYLRCVPHGPARVLWMESVGALRWALVRIEQSNLEEIVFITSNTPDSEGFYPGFVQRWDVQTGIWSNRYACKVLDANR